MSIKATSCVAALRVLPDEETLGAEQKPLLSSSFLPFWAKLGPNVCHCDLTFYRLRTKNIDVPKRFIPNPPERLLRSRLLQVDYSGDMSTGLYFSSLQNSFPVARTSPMLTSRWRRAGRKNTIKHPLKIEAENHEVKPPRPPPAEKLTWTHPGETRRPEE